MKLHRQSPEEDRPTWLHPSLGQRLDNLSVRPNPAGNFDDEESVGLVCANAAQET